MSISFLSYTGEYTEKETNDKFPFSFGKLTKLCKPIFIVPPVFDTSFKKVFLNDEDGEKLLKDFLNSLLFPSSKKITDLKFLQKEIPSNSHLKYNNGTIIVDNACIVKIKGKSNKVIIDIEMEYGDKGEYRITKLFNNGTSIRNENDFNETWVICFFINSKQKEKSNIYDKGSYSHGIKKMNFTNKIFDLDYVQIYEIYLNDLYKNIDKQIMIFPNEVIQERGLEWIKLFTIELWCKSHNSDIEYCIPFPEDIKFHGEEIKEAIKRLGDFQGHIKHMMLSNKQYIENCEKEKEEKIKKSYFEGKAEGYKTGQAEGYKTGQAEGYKTGQTVGFEQGYSQLLLNILDYYYKKYINGDGLENIESIGKIPYSLIEKRYTTQFIQEMYKKNLLC